MDNFEKIIQYCTYVVDSTWNSQLHLRYLRYNTTPYTFAQEFNEKQKNMNGFIVRLVRKE